MALIDQQMANFLNDMRNYAQSVKQANIEGMKLSKKWFSLGFALDGSNPMNQEKIDATPEYAGLTPAELLAAVVSVIGLTAWYDAGNYDQLSKIEP